MANGKMATSLVLVLVAMLCAGATAQSSCITCIRTLISLSPCLNHITGNSSTPSQQCCTQLANVVRSSPQFLCEVLNAAGSLLGITITINTTRAFTLPGSCNVQIPPISSCNAASPAPAPAPAVSSVGLSDGSTTKLSLSLLIFLLLATSYSSFFSSN